MQETAEKTTEKPKTVAINPRLHRLLKLIAARDGQGMNDIAEPPLWEVVKANAEWLEKMTGEEIAA